jgi:hypothetical protein
VLEASYQHYKGRVNFLWVYGNEAHPEEHAYSITHSMEERAQRAKWMKTDEDPDLEISMAIDFINDPPNPDDEIRRNYFGGGYYSCYVIDCDGEVLRAHPCGWHDADGEWWGLPLALLRGVPGLARRSGSTATSGSDTASGEDRPGPSNRPQPRAGSRASNAGRATRAPRTRGSREHSA